MYVAQFFREHGISACCENHTQPKRGEHHLCPLARERVMTEGTGFAVGPLEVDWLCPSPWATHSVDLSLYLMVINCAQQ